MKALFLFLLTFSTTALACETELTRLPPRSDLEARLANADARLAPYRKFRLTDFRPVKYLGAGASGSTLLIRNGQRELILKLMYGPARWQTPTPRMRREVRDAIVIQEFLSQFGIAPKVYGLVSNENLKQWLEDIQYFERILPELLKSRPPSAHKDDITDFTGLPQMAGFVMESIDGASAKDSHTTLDLTPEQKTLAIQKSSRINEIIAYYGIFPMDPDLIVTPDGNVVLIDLAQYFPLTQLAPEDNNDRSVGMHPFTMLVRSILYRQPKASNQ